MAFPNSQSIAVVLPACSAGAGAGKGEEAGTIEKRTGPVEEGAVAPGAAIAGADWLTRSVALIMISLFWPTQSFRLPFATLFGKRLVRLAADEEGAERVITTFCFAGRSFSKTCLSYFVAHGTCSSVEAFWRAVFFLQCRSTFRFDLLTARLTCGFGIIFIRTLEGRQK